MPEKCALSHGSGVLGHDPRDSCRFWSPHVENVWTVTQIRLGEGGGGGDTIGGGRGGGGGGGGGRRTENRDHILSIYRSSSTIDNQVCCLPWFFSDCGIRQHIQTKLDTWRLVFLTVRRLLWHTCLRAQCQVSNGGLMRPIASPNRQTDELAQWHGYTVEAYKSSSL